MQEGQGGSQAVALLAAAALILATSPMSARGQNSPILSLPSPAAACESAFIEHVSFSGLSVSASYGNFNDFACSVAAFLESSPSSLSTKWAQRFENAQSAKRYFYEAGSVRDDTWSNFFALAGSDITPPDGVNSNAVVFMDVAHGSYRGFQVQAGDIVASPKEMTLGRVPSPLRYFWQCSCQVFGHGDAVQNNYPNPGSFPGAWDDRDNQNSANAWMRWWPSLSGGNLRLACGGSTIVDCSPAHMESLWFYRAIMKAAVADSFILGLIDSTSVPVCLTLGSKDPGSCPLSDEDFKTDGNVPGSSPWVYLEYPKVIFSWMESPMKLVITDLVFADLTPQRMRGVRAMDFALSGATPHDKRFSMDDGFDHYEDDTVIEQYEQVENDKLSGDEIEAFISRARDFVRENWPTMKVAREVTCAVALFVVSSETVHQNPASAKYLKSVFVTFYSGEVRLSDSCGLEARRSMSTSFAVVEETAQRSIKRAVVHIGTARPGGSITVDLKSVIDHSGIDLQNFVVGNVGVVYVPLGKLLLPKLDLQLIPLRRDLPIEHYETWVDRSEGTSQP